MTASARLLLDEMIGPRVAEQLRAQGLDVRSVVTDAALRGLPDETVLEHAHQDQRILVTRNIVDFARLDQHWKAEHRGHAGLVMVPEQAFPQNRNLVGSLVNALAAAAHTGTLPTPGLVLYLRPAG